MKSLDEGGQDPGGGRLPAADGHRAAQFLGAVRQLPLDLFLQPEHLLGPAAQEHPLLGELQFAAAPAEQGAAQLLLQLGHLAAEGGLGNVQRPGRPGDVPLPGHSEEITEQAQFHGSSPFFILI